jgi:hypothetical protein
MQSHFMAWLLNPLPDFLADHTLADFAPAEKLAESVGRWVQWVASLWRWRDRATFAIRYVCRDGNIHVYLLARSHAESDQQELGEELQILLRAHRLCLDAETRRVDTSPRLLHDLHKPAIAEVRQYEKRQLCDSLLTIHALPLQLRNIIPQQELDDPSIVFPWWGPGGPFLAPMECLLAQPIPCSITVYLQPTELTNVERRWLATLAREAQSTGEQQVSHLGVNATLRVSDPTATLFGRITAANLRRLSTEPFLVWAHCAAEHGDREVASRLAGSMQTLIHEKPFEQPHQDDDRLPSGASVAYCSDTSSDHWRVAHAAYESVTFPALTSLALDPNRAASEAVLSRIPYLADARGAATIFRLPVSVRGGVPGVGIRQLPPDFHPGQRVDRCPAGHLTLGHFHSGGIASIPVESLRRHALITGTTGSGKTVSVVSILIQLWRDYHIPFLVVESAKHEYRNLMRDPALTSDLNVYTAGNELCSPFRINPFELLPGLRLELHISRLQTCFEAAMPQIGPSSSVIHEALHGVYETAGWCLTDVCPVRPKRRFPTLHDFVAEVETVIERRGYDGELRNNLRAAIVGRLKPLLLGGKGRMFGAQHSQPSMQKLLDCPTILELNDLNVDDKALVAIFLLTLLREFRETSGGTSQRLVHVTVVEEAHNILGNNVSKATGEASASSDARYQAVEAFCQALTEIRALGEGLIISDQSPEKLARDVIRNSNLLIMHQLRDKFDRDTVGRASLMETEQQDYLAKLQPGEAAVFCTGMEKATFVRVDDQRQDSSTATAEEAIVSGFIGDVSDREVRVAMTLRNPDGVTSPSLSLPMQGCQFCRTQCQFRDAMFADSLTQPALEARKQILAAYADTDSVDPQQLWTLTITSCRGALSRTQTDYDRPADHADAAWCAFLHHVQSEQELNQSKLETSAAFYAAFLDRWRAQANIAIRDNLVLASCQYGESM